MTWEVWTSRFLLIKKVMVCECIQDPLIGSTQMSYKAKDKLQNYEYKFVSFFMSQATSGFESVKKLCTEWTGSQT